MTDQEYKDIDWTTFRPAISCRGADILPLDAIEEFQGNLKKRTKKDIDKIIRSIYEYGFSFPFYIWVNDGHNMCIDGHGRILALSEMRKRGTDLPCFPVVYVEAQDEAEAKQKLLRLNSQYGTMTLESVIEFAGDIELCGDEISIPGVKIGIDDTDRQDSEPDDDKFSAITVTAALATASDAYELAGELTSRGLIVKVKGA